MVNHVLAALPFVSMFGFAGLAANLVLGFEEAHASVLLGSGILIAAAPLGAALHIALANELSREEKQLWISGLLSHKGPALLTAYFNLVDRKRVTQTLSRAPITDCEREV
jgi:hypothetical protein